MSDSEEVITLRDVGTRLPSPPKGIYRVRLYGQAGGVLYECLVPPCQSFQYVCPTHVCGLKVYGFQMLWEPAS